MAALLHAPLDRLVGELVELLHVLTLDIGPARLAEDVGQAGHVHLGADDLAGHHQVVEQTGEFTGGARVEHLIVHDLAADGDTLAFH